MVKSVESENFDFEKYEEGTKCLVLCADNVVRVAYPYKHHPASDEPSVFFTRWITDSDTCKETKEGYLTDYYGQNVLVWLTVDELKLINVETEGVFD